MRYFLEIQIENEAFVDHPHAEIAQILERAKDRVLNARGRPIGQDENVLRDSNGNRVGRHGFDSKRVKGI